MSELQIIAIPLLPLLGFLLNGVAALAEARGVRIFSRRVVNLIACSAPLTSFILSARAFVILKNNPTLMALTAPNLLDWMVLDGFSLSFGFSVDHLASVMTLIVTGVGLLIHVYSTAYMREDPAFTRYMSFLNLFLFFMLTLVMADSLAFLFVGWEGVGLCSYLLIGFWFTEKQNAVAGKKAFIVNRIGDFAFLIGMFAIVASFSAKPGWENEFALPMNYLDYLYMTAHADVLTPWAGLIVLCLFIGATGKSAQIPLYVWLPDAMAGPTPVSALIHAATMVTAGVYMVARLGFLFVMSPLVMDIIVTVGMMTALMAALIALTQNDIKKVLAYSTVSQLGFMVMGLGVGGFSAAIFHVMTHAFFKACLFLGAGSVIHALHHEQDIRNMGGLIRKMPITAVTFLLSTLAIAGVPPLSGFFSKDEILYLLYANAPHRCYYWIALATAGLTAFYMMRLFVIAFMGSCRHPHPDHIQESPFAMTLPLVVLAGLAVVGGAVGLPHILGHNYFADWLAALGQKTPHHLPGSSLQEGHLMAISALWGGACLMASWWMFTRGLAGVTALKRRCAGLHRLLADKFRIDEVYDALLITPLRVFSDKFLNGFVDKIFIDGLFVHGFADVSRFVSGAVSFTQTGLLSHYLIYLMAGVCCVLAFIVLG